MPNLLPPITTVTEAEKYRTRILSLLPADTDFQPLMTLYLTDNTPVSEIEKAALSPFVHALKMYPAGATTNSDAGVTSISKVMKTLSAMQECGLPFLVHGEVTRSEIDVFDREAVFIEEILTPLIEQLPDLKIVLEHITTRQGAEFVKNATDNVAATITPHHLLLNRNALFKGGINPHHYCLPILKREEHRQALLEAATSGNSRFFLGTDSAPHMKSRKENACGCAGIYSSHAAIEFYAMVFESLNALDKLEAFASLNGPAYYNLPVNNKKITLKKTEWSVPESYPFGGENVVPFYSGQTLNWKLV
jgi:dihydroorotase